jgi:hypothetical protein
MQLFNILSPISLKIFIKDQKNVKKTFTKNKKYDILTMYEVANATNR